MDMNEPNFTCPKCQGDLDEGFCFKGHGIFKTLNLQHRFFGKAATQKIWQSLKSASFSAIRCPKCKSQMHILSDPIGLKLEIDACQSCYSIWLDAHESEVLQEFIRTRDPIQDGTEKYQGLARTLLTEYQNKQKFKRAFEVGQALSRRVHPFNYRYFVFKFFYDLF